MTVSDASPDDAVRDAFRELHGTRLHGFALLLTLGDRAVAGRLAAVALADGALRVGELRHPERAAAWLRARVVRGMGRGLARGSAPGPAAGLVELDVRPAVRAGLSRLSPLERAVMVATFVERFDRRDVATIVGRDGAAFDRLVRRARREFTAGHAAARGPEARPVSGPVTTGIRRTAERALQ